MLAKALLRESDQLKVISQNLELLAEKHPTATEALLTIGSSVRNTATLLEVYVATKLPLPA